MSGCHQELGIGQSRVIPGRKLAGCAHAELGATSTHLRLAYPALTGRAVPFTSTVCHPQFQNV